MIDISSLTTMTGKKEMDMDQIRNLLVFALFAGAGILGLFLLF